MNFGRLPPHLSSLYTVVISRQTLRVADVVHGSEWSQTYPNLASVSLAVSTNIAQPQGLPAKQLSRDFHVVLYVLLCYFGLFFAGPRTPVTRDKTPAYHSP